MSQKRRNGRLWLNHIKILWQEFKRHSPCKETHKRFATKGILHGEVVKNKLTASMSETGGQFTFQKPSLLKLPISASQAKGVLTFSTVHHYMCLINIYIYIFKATCSLFLYSSRSHLSVGIFQTRI